jgi:hypothetical protein
MKRLHHRLAKGVAIAANQQFVLVVERPREQSTLQVCRSYCDKIFDPLEDWEQKWVVGSGSARRIPNCIYYGVSNIPFRHLAFWWSFNGLRQTLLFPPPHRPSPLPQLPASSVGILPIANLKRSMTLSSSVSVHTPGL